MATRIGPYDILGDLGSGGMSQIFRARDMRLGREVAIKLLSDELVRDPDAVERFLREARAASALNHPNIVTIFEASEESGQYYIAMELVRGRTLRAIIAEGQRFIEALPDVTIQIVRALAAAHEAGIVHRDIKPENVMVRDDGYVKVVDFGIARLMSSGSEGDAQLAHTRTGSVVGTPRYMSPEQIAGDAMSPSSDFFSLGVVLYEWVTGQHPFPADSVMRTLFAIMSETPVLPSHLNPAVPVRLEELLMDMLHKDPAARPTAAEIIQRLAPPRASAGVMRSSLRTRAEAPTVGRRAERRLLRDALESVRKGRGALVGIAGEPGIGKTSLVEDVLGDIELDIEPWFIARGRCSERLAGSEAYLPFLEAFDSLLRTDGREKVMHLMKSVAPSWYGQLSVVITPTSSSDERKPTSQDRLKRELLSLLAELSSARPLVMFLEDLHWADDSTLDLLAYVASHFDTLRLRIVTTYRPAELELTGHPFLSLRRELEGRGLAEEITLGFLTRDQIDEYLRLVFPRARFPEALASLVHAKSEGNPLFMSDLARDLRDRGVIAREGDAWVLARDISDFERELPASIRSMVQRKIDSLDKDDRDLLVVASVQGVQFDTTIVARALGADPARLEERLDALERKHAFIGLVGENPLPDGTPSSQFRFVHALYQNGLYASLRPVRRAALSGTIAQLLVEAFSNDLMSVAAELALLFETARDMRNAATHFATAAKKAGDVFADKEAITLARRGIAALTGLAHTPELVPLELGLQLALGKSLIRTQGYAVPEVERAYTRARELCEHVKDPLRMCLVLHGLWQFFCVKGDLLRGTELAEQLHTLARDAGDTQLLAIAHRTFGTPYLQRARYAECIAHMREAIALTDPAQVKRVASLTGTDVQSGALCWIALCEWLLGNPEEGQKSITRAVDYAQTIGLPFSRAHTLAVAAWFGHFTGQPAAVREYADMLVTIALERQFEYWVNVGYIFRGWGIAALGDPDAGLIELRRGIDAFQRTGAQLNVPHFGALHAEVLQQLGRPDEALQVVEQALQTAERNDDRCWESGLLTLRAELQRELGNEADAALSFERAIAVARAQQAVPLEARAIAAQSQLPRRHRSAQRHEDLWA